MTKKHKHTPFIKFYICDLKQCGSDCCYPQCKHTSEMKHALYSNHNWDDADLVFDKEKYAIFEKERYPSAIKNAGAVVRMPS